MKRKITILYEVFTANIPFRTHTFLKPTCRMLIYPIMHIFQILFNHENQQIKIQKGADQLKHNLLMQHGGISTGWALLYLWSNAGVWQGGVKDNKLSCCRKKSSFRQPHSRREGGTLLHFRAVNMKPREARGAS